MRINVIREMAGRAADAFGLPVTMWIMGACAVVATMLALLLKETAPVKTSCDLRSSVTVIADRQSDPEVYR